MTSRTMKSSRPTFSLGQRRPGGVKSGPYRSIVIAFLAGLLLASIDRAPSQPTEQSLPAQLKSLDPMVLSPNERAAAMQAIRRSAGQRRDEVNRLDREAWAQINSRASWEHFVKPRI